LQLNICLNEPPQQFRRFSDHLADLQSARLQNLTAAERQQLLGDGGGPPCGLLDRRRIALKFLIPGRTVENQLGVTTNHGQQIVKIVRHSPGKLSYRFHFLR